MTFWRPIAGNLDSSWHVPCTEAFVAQLFAFSSLAKLLYPWRLRTLCCLQLQTIDAAWSAIPAGFANFWTRRIELGWTPLLQIALAISWLVLPKVSSCLPWSLLKTKDKRNNWVVPSSRELRHEMFILVQRLGRLTVSSWGSAFKEVKNRASVHSCLRLPVTLMALHRKVGGPKNLVNLLLRSLPRPRPGKRQPRSESKRSQPSLNKT